MKDYLTFPAVRVFYLECHRPIFLWPFLKPLLILSAFLVLCIPQISHAVTIYAKVSAHIIPALSATVVTGLNFGSLSSGDTPGEIIVSANGAHRWSSGGVQLRNGEDDTPATIQVMGAKNQTYSISLPRSIHLLDEYGHDMIVDGFETSANAGHLDGRGLQNVKIGGHLKVTARQGVGSYSGILPVVLDYN